MMNVLPNVLPCVPLEYHATTNPAFCLCNGGLSCHCALWYYWKDLGFQASYYVRLPEGNLLLEIMINLRLPTRRFLVQLCHQWQWSNLPWWSTHWEAFRKRCPLDDFWKKDMGIIERATCSSNKSVHNCCVTLSLYLHVLRARNPWNDWKIGRLFAYLWTKYRRDDKFH